MRKLLVLTVLCACLQGARALPEGTGGPFPAIDGWRLSIDSNVFTPDNLWNIIDGAADAYLLYGFLDLHIGEYASPESVDVRAELYAHSSAANAFGIYSQERKPGYGFTEVGTEGYIEDGVLNFLSGTYYVKLTSHTPGAEGREALRVVAQAIVARLAQQEGFPPQLALLPSTGRIARSESYIADSYLGYSFFRSAFVAQYGKEGKVQCFVMELDSPAAARSTLERYRKTLNEPADTVRDGRFTLADPNNGTIGMLLTGRYLCGVVNCEEPKMREEYLTALKEKLRKD